MIPSHFFYLFWTHKKLPAVSASRGRWGAAGAAQWGESCGGSSGRVGCHGLLDILRASAGSFSLPGSALVAAVAAVAAVALRMILVFFCFSGMIAEDSITCQRIDAETQTTYSLYSETAVAWRWKYPQAATHLSTFVPESASSSEFMFGGGKCPTGHQKPSLVAAGCWSWALQGGATHLQAWETDQEVDMTLCTDSSFQVDPIFEEQILYIL